ncbi:hypothetical protein METUNv1_02698 [Methyloversatilis universalis FAM5]|uniref:Uncharacterized protein n=1 Tax=Methyloversatilis universalis (strain ATCC BAA-1314 / DSM 25237 / JCM 13912 / CCUG 52030 / FAM5) TaxID=1000565 RepID=F5REH7_METUF|nr:hypothetical protein METUNv1_02698 [Methyloversatilis universalis FAM5]
MIGERLHHRVDLGQTDAVADAGGGQAGAIGLVQQRGAVELHAADREAATIGGRPCRLGLQIGAFAARPAAIQLFALARLALLFFQQQALRVTDGAVDVGLLRRRRDRQQTAQQQRGGRAETRHEIGLCGEWTDSGNSPSGKNRTSVAGAGDHRPPSTGGRAHGHGSGCSR